MPRKAKLRVPAIRARQGDHEILLFAVDGQRLHEFTAVSRIHRDDDRELVGYQRPEVQTHIRAIRRYLESPGALLPNALVVAFDSSVTFRAERKGSLIEGAEVGVLEIPVDPEWDEADKPAWLVDGQQRSAAIRDARVENFLVAVVGFIAADEGEQRTQFILVNNTKPLPKGLIHELLPETSGELPIRYAKRKLPAYLLSRLNTDLDSPFRGLIATPTEPNGYIKDNSVLKMVENSLYEGAVYQYRDPASGDGDEEEMLIHLKSYWTVVAKVFPEAWVLPPRKSRLTHGVGIQSLGYVMDSLTEGTSASELGGIDLEGQLEILAPHVAWTTGSWDFGDGEGRRWNGLQNTPNDVRLLTNHLLRTLRENKVGRGRSRRKEH